MSLRFEEKNRKLWRVYDDESIVAYMFRRHPTKWEISFISIVAGSQYELNLAAAKRKVIATYVAHKLESAA